MARKGVLTKRENEKRKRSHGLGKAIGESTSGGKWTAREGLYLDTFRIEGGWGARWVGGRLGNRSRGDGGGGKKRGRCSAKKRGNYNGAWTNVTRTGMAIRFG